MQIDFNLATVISFSLIAQGVFAVAMLLLKKENKEANRYLAILILTFCCWLCDAFFSVSGLYQQNPDLYFLPIYFSFAFGPLLYWYTRSLSQGATPFGRQQLYHFVPVGLQAGFYIFLQLQDYAFRRWFWFEVHQPYTYDLELVISLLILLVYLYLGLMLLRRYRSEIENNFSELSRITLKWLRSIHLVLGVLAFFWLIEATGRLVWDYFPITPLSYLTIGFMIVFLAIGAVLQADLSAITEDISMGDEATKGSERKEINAGSIQLIRDTMEERELFLQQDLSLKMFAKAVDLPTRETSLIINQGLGVSFIDFVNGYRVARFKDLVKDKDYQHLSLLGLALESGFNAKSTFNRVFRKLEGQSPSEYQKQSQNGH